MLMARRQPKSFEPRHLCEWALDGLHSTALLTQGGFVFDVIVPALS